MTQTIDSELHAPASSTSGLTEAEWAILAERFPEEAHKTRKVPGGGTSTYIALRVLEDRVRRVDPNFDCFVNAGSDVITVHYRIKGVTRGEVFDIPEKANRGTPATTAVASAKRRALGKGFGVGGYLWPDNEGEDDGIPPEHTSQATSAPQAAASQNGHSPRKAVSESQVKFLVDLGVPEAIAKQLDAFREKDSSNNWFSQAGLVIDFLKPGGLGGNQEKPAPPALVREAITKYAPTLVPAKKQQKPVDPFNDADPD